jgi:hypothetical protein
MAETACGFGSRQPARRERPTNWTRCTDMWTTGIAVILASAAGHRHYELKSLCMATRHVRGSYMKLIARRARGIVLAGVAAALVSGCASTQLNHNTLDLASSTDDLLSTQILHNFANFIDSRAALPAQLSISSGTATTTNTVTPSVSLPITQTLATTNTLAVTAAAATSSTLTGQRVGSVSPITSNLSASNVAAQNWAYSPITDPYRMHRLAALYRLAVDWSADDDQGEWKFKNHFPLVQKVKTHSVPSCILGYYKDRNGYETASPVLSNSGKVLTYDRNGRPKIDVRELSFCATGSIQSGNFTHAAETDSFSTQEPDERYLQGPGCILCLPDDWPDAPVTKKNLCINKLLKGTWLHWIDVTGANNRPGRAWQPGDLPLGHSGHYEFYEDKRQPGAFVEFSIAVLNASTVADQPLGGSAGSGAPTGAASQTPKATPLELTLPIPGG